MSRDRWYFLSLVVAHLASSLTLGAARTAERDFAIEQIYPPLVVGDTALYPIAAENRVQGISWQNLSGAMERDPESARDAHLFRSPRFENSSPRDWLYIQAGEILRGGKSDRVVGESYLLPPGAAIRSPHLLSIESAHRSRGQGNQRYFDQSAGLLPHRHLLLPTEYYGNERLLAVEIFEWQNAMSQRLGRDVRARGAHSNLILSQYQALSAPPLRNLCHQIHAHWRHYPRANGIALVVAGELVRADFYTDPRLFAAQREKLFDSYASEALLERGRSTKSRSGLNRDQLREILTRWSPSWGAPRSRHEGGLAYQGKFDRWVVSDYLIAGRSGPIPLHRHLIRLEDSPAVIALRHAAPPPVVAEPVVIEHHHVDIIHTFDCAPGCRHHHHDRYRPHGGYGGKYRGDHKEKRREVFHHAHADKKHDKKASKSFQHTKKSQNQSKKSEKSQRQNGSKKSSSVKNEKKSSSKVERKSPLPNLRVKSTPKTRRNIAILQERERAQKKKDSKKK